MLLAEFSAVFLVGRCHAGVVLGSVGEVLRKPSRSLGEVLGRPAGSFGYESSSRVVREWYECCERVVREWYESNKRVVREWYGSGSISTCPNIWSETGEIKDSSTKTRIDD